MYAFRQNYTVHTAFLAVIILILIILDCVLF